jgi:NAD(P)-dependent dehydrogenase (short-subunit alcohol dehydrogenase family)
MERKRALVTGAGRNIGRAIALHLAEVGYDVGVHYRSSEEGARDVCRRAEEVGARAIPLGGDIRNIDAIDAMFHQFVEAFGGIDLLVNNAGITRYRPFLEVTEELWHEVVDTDWKGSFFCAQRAARAMVEQGGGGVIINISSNQQDGCWPHANVYGPTKAALAKFTRNAALELAPHGIRVNAVAPGYTAEPGTHRRLRSHIESRLPIGRFVEPVEVARAVAYLASDAAAAITGACLTIDGGALLPVVPENNYRGDDAR